jgi:small ligand-binding sensory domain FIST
LLDPQALPPEPWLNAFNQNHSAAIVLGGLTCGPLNPAPQPGGVFRNGRVCEQGLLVSWVGGGLKLHGLVSQGCRPIGEPLTVTRAENNVVYALGAQPAYQALESAFQTLSDQEKSTARGNLLAGLATSEYVEDFQPGDFLVRSIIGADPNSGAVVIGGVPRVGQTLQYQYRDRQAARADLTRQLRQASAIMPRPLAAILFSCVGRGQAFFGSPHHDVSCVGEVFGQLPTAGFLGQGEIGPLHGVNCLTTYSAAVGLFFDDEESI